VRVIHKLFVFFLVLVFWCHEVRGNESIRDEMSLIDGTISLRTDFEGVVISRMSLLVGPAHFLLLRERALFLRQVVLAPGGYEQIRVQVGASGENGWLAPGVAAGPVIIGPMREHGIFQRFRDPTAGGAGWSALREDDRFTLDTRFQTPLRQGGQISLNSSRILAGSRRQGWLVPRVSAWLTYDREEREVAGFYVGNSFSFTRGSVDIAFLSAYSQVALPEERFIRDPWVFLVPPIRSQRLYHQGLVFSFSNAIAHLIAEGWRQHSLYQPPRYAGTIALRGGTPLLEISTRVSAAQIGYMTVNHRPTARSLFAGGRLTHRRDTERGNHEMFLEFTHHTRWQTGLPAPGEWHVVTQIGHVGHHPLQPGGNVRVNWRQEREPYADVRITMGTGSPFRVSLRSLFQERGLSLVGGTVQVNIRSSLGGIRKEVSASTILDEGVSPLVSGAVILPLRESGSITIAAQRDERNRQKWSGTITGTVNVPRSSYQSPR